MELLTVSPPSSKITKQKAKILELLKRKSIVVLLCYTKENTVKLVYERNIKGITSRTYYTLVIITLSRHTSGKEKVTINRKTVSMV